MIAEIWDFLTTKASNQARKQGYLYSAIALSYRARRCKKFWESHLKNCHEEIIKIPNVDSLVVLGSGLLLETPLEILNSKANRITLVDIVHTKEARQKVLEFNQKNNFKATLVELDLNKVQLCEKFDYYISANILSQLQQLAQQDCIQEHHLEILKQIAPQGLLFSDFQLDVIDLENKIIDSENTVNSNLNIKWSKTWSWDLAPAPEISKDYNVRLQVGSRFE